MPVQEYQIVTLIVVVIVVLIIACFFIFILVAFANQRKRKHLQEKLNMAHNFQQELLKTKLEIQEQTLNNISQEIHDNIGQVLSLAKLNLATIDNVSPGAQSEKIRDSRLLVGKAIQDLRDLSKTINPDYIIEMGLLRSVENELETIEKTGVFATSLKINGAVRKLGAQKELILFRIIQESLNNAIKHSQASHVELIFTYDPDYFELQYRDNGIGFDTGQVKAQSKPGLGMKNIESRAAMIEATYELTSEPGNGTSLIVKL